MKALIIEMVYIAFGDILLPSTRKRLLFSPVPLAEPAIIENNLYILYDFCLMDYNW